MIAAPVMNLLLPLATDPVGHVVNHPWIVSENGLWIWSAHTTMLILAGVITVGLGLLAARQIQVGPETEGDERYITKNPFAHMLEVLVWGLRDKVIEPLLHERTDRMLPYLLTLFFFILSCNLLGMVPLLDLYHLIDTDAKAAHASPIGGTATQNLFVTAALAIFAGVMINIAGVRELGLGGYIKHLTAGAPVFVWPIIVPIEVMGIVIKPVALAIRLFANMTAGHILLAVILGFTGAGFAAGLLIGVPVFIASTLGAIAIFFLEVFVAFLQAFVFMFLTTVFISLLAHHEHEPEDEPGFGHAHGHTHEHEHGRRPEAAHA